VQKKYVDAFLILNEVKKNADEKIGANVNYSIAYIYQEIENFEEALKYIHLALKYYEETNNNFQIAICNNFLGSIYSHLNKNDLALKYYNNSLNLVADTVSSLDYALVIGNIGMIKNREKKYGEAIEMYQKAAEIFDRPGDKLHLANIYNNMANTYFSLNSIVKSEEYYRRAKTIYIELNDEKRVASCLLGLANLQQETNPEQALAHYLEAARIAKKYNYLSLQKELYLALYEFYENQQDYMSSLDYHKKYLVVKDSIFNIDKERSINNLTISYEVEKKDRQIQSLQNENQLRQKTIEGQKQKFVLLITILVIIIVFSLLMSYMLITKNQVLKRLVKKNKELLYAEESLGKNIIKVNDLKGTQNTVEKNIATQILKIMEDDRVFLQNDLSVSLIAAYCNTNPKYISQTINNVFGQKFNSFINEYRIKYACRLLMQEEYKNYTLSAISEEVGFNSISTFISSFKKNTGVTPSYYIKNMEK
jgi:AraC-like DNA-binding protein